MESNKPKVLMFTDWYLPGYKAGGPIKSCANMVANLKDRVRFYIVCSNRDYLEDSPYPEVTSNTWTDVDGAAVLYLSAKTERYSTIRSIIRTLEPDRIYINGIFSQVYSIYPLRVSRRSNAEVIVAPRGMMAPGAMAIKSLKKIVFLRLIRLLGGYRHVTFHATDSSEAEHIRRRIGADVSLRVIPNIPGLPGNQGAQRRPAKRTNRLISLTVARIAPEKNIVYALKRLAEIPDHIDVHHRFIGPVYDQKYLAECEELAAALPGHVSVEFSGAWPPSSIAEALRDTHLFFLPTLGENFGHAIIEALLSNVPVLISDRTPWRNLETQSLGYDVDLRESDTFVARLTEVGEMNAEQYAQRFGQTAVRARSLIDIPRITSDYQQLLT